MNQQLPAKTDPRKTPILGNLLEKKTLITSSSAHRSHYVK